MNNLLRIVRLEKKEDKEYETRQDIERKRMNYTYGVGLLDWDQDEQSY